MPYETRYIDAEPFMEHRGVVLYHTYKDDDLCGCRLQYWYGLTPDCSFEDDTVFDVRDVALRLGPPWSTAPVEEVLKRSVDLALDGRAGDAGPGFFRCWEHRKQYVRQSSRP